MSGFIYGLYAQSSPEEIRYIGVSKNVVNRFGQHLREAKKGKRRTYKNNWIVSVLSSGDKLAFIILAEFYSTHDAYATEDSFIEAYKEKGHKLTNMAEGGTHAVRTTPEEARKLATTPEALERSRLAALKRWNNTAKEDRAPYNKGISMYGPEGRPRTTITGLSHGSEEHREHQRKKTIDYFENVRRDPQKLQEYKKSRMDSGKKTGPKKKQEWANLSGYEYNLRRRNMSLGRRYNRAKRSGWVLELTPVTYNCEECA